MDYPKLKLAELHILLDILEEQRNEQRKSQRESELGSGQRLERIV